MLLFKMMLLLPSFFLILLVRFITDAVILSTQPGSPISTSSGVVGAFQCSKNADETFAVCASNSNTAIKYNLQPFSFAIKGPNQGNYMRSGDLYETSSESTSRVICAKGVPVTNAVVYFHRISDMTVFATVTIGSTDSYPHVIVDTPNQLAYVTNFNNPPAIYKITDIGSSTPIVAGTLSSFGSGDQKPAAMLIIDGFLYVHFDMSPAARLARINISTFTWSQTVNFVSGETYGSDDSLAKGDNYIYDLTQNGIVVRCTYDNNNFARFDSLSTGLTNTYSLAISPDKRTLFVVSTGNNVLQLINTAAAFSMFGNTPSVPSALGRPIITSWCNVYAFSQGSDSVYAFRLNSSVCRTPSAELTKSSSTQKTMTTTVSTDVSRSVSASSMTTTESTDSSRSVSESSDSSASVTNSVSSVLSQTNSASSQQTNTATESTDVSRSVSASMTTTESTDSSRSVSASMDSSASVTNSVSSAVSLSNSASAQQTMTTTVSTDDSRSESLSTNSSATVANSESATLSRSFTKTISRSSSTSSSSDQNSASIPTSKSTSTSLPSVSISFRNSETIWTTKTERTRTTSGSDTPSNTLDETSSKSQSSKFSRSSSGDASSSASITSIRTKPPQPTTTTNTTTTTATSTTKPNTTTTSLLPSSTSTTSTTTNDNNTLRNRTKTHTIEIPVRPPSVQVSPATASITTTVVVVTSLAGNSALGPLMVRNGLILLGGSCGDDVGPLDVATSPLGLEFGNDDYKYWNGAVIGDFIIIIGVFPVLLLVSVIYVKIFNKDRPWNEYLVGVRTITGTFFFVLSGPIIVGFIASISFSSAGAETFGVLVVGLTTLAATVLWPLYILRRVKKEMQLEDLQEADHDVLELMMLDSQQPFPEAKEKKTSALKRFHQFLFDSRTGAEWTPLLHELKVGWAYLFQHSSNLYYVAIEVICGTGINVTLGLMQDPGATGYSCRTRALINLMLHIPPTAFLLFANPLFSRFDLVVTTAMWIAKMFSSLMLVLKLFNLGLPIDETLFVVGLILAVLNLVASFALAADAWHMLRLLQKQKSSNDFLEMNTIMNNVIDGDLDELLLYDLGVFLGDNRNNENNNITSEEGNQEIVIPLLDDNDDDDDGEENVVPDREQDYHPPVTQAFDEDYLAELEKLMTSVKNERDGQQ